MADPQRLLVDPDASPLGRALLASAGDDEGPGRERRARLAGRLGIAASLAITATTSEGLAAALWWKLGTVLLALGGVTALAVSQTPDGPPPRPRVPAVVATAPVYAPAPPPAVVAPAPPPVVAPAPAPLPPPVIVQVRPQPSPPSPTKAPVVAETRKVQAAPPPAPAPPVEPPPPPVEVQPPPVEVQAPPVEPPPPVQIDARRLAAEVALLDRARTALRARDATTAIAALEEYRRTFPDGALLAEAEVVLIEALVQRGDAAAAAERARAFLARFPSSPLARRVRSIALKETTP
jgi:hypothetical protein